MNSVGVTYRFSSRHVATGRFNFGWYMELIQAEAVELRGQDNLPSHVYIDKIHVATVYPTGETEWHQPSFKPKGIQCH